MSEFPYEEWAKVLGERQNGHAEQDDGWLTSHEIAAWKGWSERVTLKNLHEWDSEGRLDVQYVLRKTIARTMCSVPTYRLKVIQ